MSYHQPIPPGFKTHKYERTYQLSHAQEKVWEVLLRQSTFSETQIWPFRVEFEQKKKYMEEGMDNIHHGPFMLFSGIVTTTRPPAYRDLHYYSGSYFLNLRWIRPARLEFNLLPQGDITLVTLGLTTYIRSWVRPFWNLAMRMFWSNFGRWLNRRIGKH